MTRHSEITIIIEHSVCHGPATPLSQSPLEMSSCETPLQSQLLVLQHGRGGQARENLDRNFRLENNKNEIHPNDELVLVRINFKNKYLIN